MQQIEKINWDMKDIGSETSPYVDTLMKEFKIRNSAGSMVVAPSWSRAYRVKTVYRTNDQGDWFQVIVTDDGWSTPEQKDARDMARQFFIEARERGVVLGRPPEADGAASSASDSNVYDGDEPPI